MKIVILDAYTANPGDLSWEPLRELGELTIYDRTKPEEVVERSKDAEVVLTNKVIISREVMDQLPTLRYIGVLATGYNVVDIDYAHERGIAVTNIPAYSTDSVAQMVFAFLLNITNSVQHYTDENRKGRWTASPDFSYADTELRELSALRLGIVGLGNIGQRVAQIANVFGMEVDALTSKSIDQLPPYIRKTTLEGMLASCDVITLHCPLTPQTREMICRETIDKARRPLILINTGRGPLINEQDVSDALVDGRLKAYCADVLTVEPAVADNPLLTAPNVYLTPHIAWATKEARKRLVSIACSNVKAFCQGEPVNLV